MANQISQQMAQNNIWMQAIGAMLRGETPQQFLTNLAKSNPQLQGLDLEHPYEASKQLYAEKGEDHKAAERDMMGTIGSLINK